MFQPCLFNVLRYFASIFDIYPTAHLDLTAGLGWIQTTLWNRIPTKKGFSTWKPSSANIVILYYGLTFKKQNMSHISLLVSALNNQYHPGCSLDQGLSDYLTSRMHKLNQIWPVTSFLDDLSQKMYETHDQKCHYLANGWNYSVNTFPNFLLGTPQGPPPPNWIPSSALIRQFTHAWACNR